MIEPASGAVRSNPAGAAPTDPDPMKSDVSMRAKSRSANHAGPSQRQLRVGENLRHLLADLLMRNELHDPRLEQAHVTVSEVRLSPDLRNATVYVAELGQRLQPTTAEALNDAAAKIAGHLARAAHMKYAPRLRFVEDDSFEEAERIERLLQNAKRQSGSMDGDDGAA